jgi:hypothetical protein
MSKKQTALSSSAASMNSSKNNKKKRKTTASVESSQVAAAAAAAAVATLRPKKKSKKKRGTRRSTTSISNRGDEPRAIDIVCGRGCGRYAKAPGNVAYRQFVEVSRWRYEAAEKQGKVDISRDIVLVVKGQPGTPRFLTENPETGVWEELSYHKSVEKTSQTFRDLRSSKPMVFPSPEEEAAAATLTKFTKCLRRAGAKGNHEQDGKQEEQPEQEEEKAASSTEEFRGQQDYEAMHAATHYKEEAEAQELTKKQDKPTKDEQFVPKAFRMIPSSKKKAAPPSSSRTTSGAITRMLPSKKKAAPSSSRTGSGATRMLPSKKKAAPSSSRTAVVAVKDTDILYGKHGLPVATHPGSQAFFRIVRFNQAKYHSCAGSKSQQNELAQSIVTMIQRQGGRFLEKKTTLERSKNKSTWRDMPNSKAVQKADQALYQLLFNSDSKPDSNDFLGLCSWLSGKSLLELQAQEYGSTAARSEDAILTPRLTDVLIGRGHGSSHHPGNLAFRWMADCNQNRYTSCLSRREKVNLIETIVAMMQHQGARFIEYNALTKAWCEISNIKAVTETSLALRRAASQSHQPLEADFQEICQSIILGASSSSKVSNTSSRLPQSVQHRFVVKEEKDPIVYSNEVFDEPSFPDSKEVSAVYANEVFFHTPVPLEPKLTISVSAMLALEPAISLGQPTSLLSTISFSADPDGSLSLGPPLMNTLSWFTTASTTSEPFFGRQASLSHPAARSSIFQRESSQQHVPPPLPTSLMSAATSENWVDALYFLPDEKFTTKHHAPAALADHSNNSTHNALDAIASPPALAGTHSFVAVWDIEKDVQEYATSSKF